MFIRKITVYGDNLNIESLRIYKVSFKSPKIARYLTILSKASNMSKRHLATQVYTSIEKQIAEKKNKIIKYNNKKVKINMNE